MSGLIISTALGNSIDTDPPRDPKFTQHELMDTAELNRVPGEKESVESLESNGGKSDMKQQSRLDSQRSYTDIVNSDHVRSRKVLREGPLGEMDNVNAMPVTAVISNMRGRSIISGGKDLFVAVNG